MDSVLALYIFSGAAYLLAFVLGSLIFYWLIRLAVTHALRSHTTWLEKRNRPVTSTIPTNY